MQDFLQSKRLPVWGHSVFAVRLSNDGFYQEGVLPFKHGHNRKEGATKTYLAWQMMKYRCLNPNCHAYALYGGRGITVCEQWMQFDGFLRDMGESPDGYSLDRIDVNGNYEPGNVRWATVIQQARNRRNNNLLQFNGETLTIAEWSEITGLGWETIKSRIKRGWSVGDALTLPVDLNFERRRGERHHNAKLSDAERKLIIELYVPGKMGYKRLAKRFGVTPPTIHKIVAAQKRKT